MNFHYLLTVCLLLFSIGVITFKKPVYSALSFLGTLLCLSVFYLELSAEFIATMQILVYAGAILVVFMFVVILFQDAYQIIYQTPSKSSLLLLITAASFFLIAIIYFGYQTLDSLDKHRELPQGFGSVQSLGNALYLDFFFPFEAVTVIFLVAAIGALYIGKKET